MIPAKVHLLSVNKTYVGAHVNGHRYVIGFMNKKQANKVSTHLDMSRTIRVASENQEDISMEINMGMRNLGFENPAVTGDLFVDAAAELYVPVNNNKRNKNVTVVEEDSGEFLMWPMTKYLGVIMPVDLDYVDRGDEWIFTSQLIRPCIDIERFRNSLVEFL